MRKFEIKRRNVLHENVIHVGAGFVAKERSHLAETLSTLGPHLGHQNRNSRGGFRNSTNNSPQRADRETNLTHITQARVIGNHADMGGSAPAAARSALTATDILRAGARRRAKRREMMAARAAWDSEGGATGDGASLSNGRGSRAPRGLGR
jgi:hypothetical protein